MWKRVGLALLGGILLSGQEVYAQTAPLPIETIAQADSEQVIRGELTTNSPVFDNGIHYNIHTFEGKAGESIRIDLISEDFDALLYIQNRSGEIIAQDDDGGEGSNSQIVITLPMSGEYKLIASSYENNLGRYRIIKRMATVDDLNSGSTSAGDWYLYQQFIELLGSGEYQEAISVVQEMIAIREQVLGSNHLGTADSLTFLANLYASLGLNREAEPLHLRALKIREQEAGVDSSIVAQSLGNLANVYTSQGEYDKAIPLLLRVLEIQEQFVEPGHPLMTIPLASLGQLYAEVGRNAEAESILMRVLSLNEEVFEEGLGSGSFWIAQSLVDLASFYNYTGKYEEAKPLFERALRLYEQESENSEYASENTTAFMGLAAVYVSEGRYAEAESLFQRAFEFHEENLGSDSPATASSMYFLAWVYYVTGRYDEAEFLLLSALNIYTKKLEYNDTNINLVLKHLGLLYWKKENTKKAIDYLDRSLEIEEVNLTKQLLAIGSERQKQDYFQTITNSTDAVISLNLQTAPTNPEAGQLALQTILRRKGRILDAVTDNIQLLRENLNPQNQRLLDDLSDKRTELAAAIFNPPETITDTYRQRIATLKGEADRLETQLARASDEFRIETEPVTIESIQTLIPTDATLIEIIQYRPFNPQTDEFADPHYAAYLLPPNGNPTWLNLGPAEPINTAAQNLRRELDNPNDLLAAKRRGRELDAMVMEPIRAKLGNAQHLLISPDSQLNLIPFAALVNENDQYLLETHQITYLTTGRDLKRLQLNQQPQSPPLIVADPDYQQPGDRTAIASNSRAAQRSQDLANLQFSDLPGTAAEAAALTNILPNATVLTRNNATENAIKQAQAPEILHIATHGFFLADVEQVAAPDWEMRGLIDVLPRPGSTPRPRGPVENPLLRSGLALAGFNPRQSGAEDGALTALEVASLNLRGTQLVILSACETGVGEVANGEGVYGLRRSLTIAGSESQVISLWKVADEETKDLMVDYYQRLQQGAGRSDGLRQVQLEMANSPDHAHPYYWAAFIPSGDWRPMSQ
jgi:CHAT domain-containing protein/Tfp pilus assembly protein PilF